MSVVLLFNKKVVFGGLNVSNTMYNSSMLRRVSSRLLAKWTRVSQMAVSFEPWQWNPHRWII